MLTPLESSAQPPAHDLPRVRKGGRSWPMIASLVVVAALAGFWLCTGAGHRGLVAAALAIELTAPPAVRPLDLITSPAVREDVSLDASGRTIHAAIYRPAGARRHGAVVFSMGVKAWPLDDPRFKRLGGSLARAGVVVMAVDSPGLRFDEIRSRDVDDLVASFQYLQDRDYVDPGRTGFLGVSVGGSLAIVAAANPRIAGRVAFIDSVGAMADVRSELKEVTTGGAGGWKADPETARVVAKQVIDTATVGPDRTLLDGLFYFGREAERAGASRLSAEGGRVYALLDNHEPSRFDSLYDDAGMAANGEFNSISPLPVLESLRAPVRVLHSRADHHVPFSEAVVLVESAPEGSSLEAFDAFDHVDPRRSRVAPGLAADGARLYAYILGLVTRLR